MKDFMEPILTLPTHGTEIPTVYAKKAAAVCLKVKELNALQRSGEDLLEAPEWVAPALDGIKKEDGSAKFEQTQDGDILRLSREPEGEARRSYRIVCKKAETGATLEVENLNFPEFTFSFNIGNADRNPTDYFLQLFSDQDERVKAHIAQREHDYYKDLGRLVANRGFTVERDDPEYFGVPMLHLKHEGYAIEREILRVPPYETIADESIEAVQSALAESDEYYLEDDEWLERLCKRGWRKEVVPEGQIHQFTDDEYVEIGRGHTPSETQAILCLHPPYKGEAVEVGISGELQTLCAGREAFKAKVDELAEQQIPDLKVADCQCDDKQARKAVAHRA